MTTPKIISVDKLPDFERIGETDTTIEGYRMMAVDDTGQVWKLREIFQKGSKEILFIHWKQATGYVPFVNTKGETL